ncbi:uncharacterized protein LOC123680603 isoform X2 [Harmonia axyridis]|uniref:uncharacterized protein LOC123680603 isoform X2 n=1 Tax=Harmonia axyridis TaxID=115357 RepID=UPI001E275E88|nr:uncharacterized protein LOC123680603 isoform X2 [Harmonia axyridis]
MILIMNFTYNTLLLFIFLLLPEELKNTEAHILKILEPLNRASDCKIYGFKIKNCDLQVSRFSNQKIEGVYEKTCNLKDLRFNFNFGKDGLYSFSMDTPEPSVTISEMKKKLESAKKIFSPGAHFIYFTMSAKSLKNEDFSGSSDKCKFFIVHENATANLGRMNKIVRSGSRVVVDGTRSMNNDLEIRHEQLEYRWSCTDTADYCDSYELGTRSRIVIPAENVVNGARFNITLEVRSPPTSWQKAVQFITVDDSRPYSVDCVRYCGKYPNTWSPNDQPVLKASCQFSCNKYHPNELHGTIQDDKGNIIIRFDNFKDPYSLKLPMQEDMHYTVKVVYGDYSLNNVLGYTTFYELKSPRLDNCKTIPPKGTPLTKFKVECDYDKESLKNFEVQVSSGDTVVFSTSSPTLEGIEFLVSSKEATVTVKLIDTHDIFTEKKVPVYIESLVKDKKNITSLTEHLNDIYEGKLEGTDSVQDLIKKGDDKRAVQLIDVVATEISKINATTEEEKKIVKDAKRRLLDDLGKIDIKDIGLSKSVSGVLKRLATNQVNNVSDSDIARSITASCRTVAKQQLYLSQNDRNTAISESEIIDLTSNLMSCGEGEMFPYYEMFNETAIDIEITTRFPINDNLSEKNFEDYPQYVADDLIEVKQNDFLTSAQHMVDICRDMASSLMFSFPSVMRQPVYVIREMSVVAVMRSTGSILANTTFTQHNVTVKATPFFAKFHSTLSMRICSYQRDPFWSASEKYRVPTNVIDLSVRDETDDKNLNKFQGHPMNVSFKVFEHLVKKKLSKGTIKLLNESSIYKEDDFSIFMIKAKSEESFFIEFQNIRGRDSFDIKVVDMERPKLKHFSEGVTMDQTHTKFFIHHSEKRDKWFMLAIKPSKNMVYFTTTPEMINCRCMHLSTLAGAFDYNELKVHPKFTHLEFELEEAQSFYVIIGVCLLVGAYFFLLVYSIQKNEVLEDAVYLMADVPAENRFAYLVVVGTGARLDAGTSSEIVIKLYGAEAQSQEHVINFPDPLMEFLQRSQNDYFVLASPVHLGKIQKIHLWFDCTGISPTWFCTNVRICDMQTKEWYAFKIQKWFKIEGKPRVFISCPASTDKEDLKSRKKRSRLLKSILSFGRFDKTIWHLSTSTTNPSFGYPKRLTLILSVIITLMMVSMELYGRPEFLPRDTITPKCYFEMRMEIVYKGLISALVTFFPHLIIMEGFKNSRLQFQSKNSRDAKPLPPAFTIVFWVVVVVNIIIQIHVLLIYGYKVVTPVTWEWLMSASIGFVFYVFILDYLYNLFLIIVSGPYKPVRINFDKLLRNIEEQRKTLYKFIGHYIYRPLLTPVYAIISRAEYLRKRIQFRQKREMVWQVHDFFMVIIFILLLYVIVLGEKDSVYDYRGHKQVMKLINGFRSSKHKLGEVNHIRDFEKFLEEGLIPAIQSYQWYGRYCSDSPGTTTDACNKYLGVIRLRQHRVEEDSCKVTKKMKFLNATCRAPDYFFRYDFLNYTPAWNNTIPEAHRSRLGYVWGFQSGIGTMFIGLAGFYGSGGYVADLGRTIENSYVNFNYLKRYNWLDPLTRAIVIEFCLYNVNKNLFHFVEVVFEKTPAGYINKDLRVKTERVVKHSSSSQLIAIFFSFIFMGLVMGLAIRTAIRIIKTSVWYRRDLWHLVDVLIVTLSVTWIIMYFKRINILRDFVKHLEENPNNAFVDYFPILSIESSMRNLAAALICISTLRMWRILRFGAIFRTVERTLLYSANSLCIMMLYYAICLIAFGEYVFVVLGSKVGQFRDEYHVLKSLICMTIGFEKAKPKDVSLNERGLGYAFSVVFSLFSTFSRTVFVAIIMVDYAKARQFAFEEKIDYNLKDYVIERYGVFKRVCRLMARKFRLTAGGTGEGEDDIVTPKKDIQRYKNCVQTDSNKMKAMASIAKCVLLKAQKGLRIDESDHELMMRTIRNMYNREDSEKVIFFKEGTKGTAHNMVDDRKILMIEKVVKRMLETPEGKAKRMELRNTVEALSEDNVAKMQQINVRLKSLQRLVNNIAINLPPDPNANNVD